MSMAVGDRDDNEPMMDMNTTPLIDVMLVLLIMFIITIPVQTHAVKIDLPVDSAHNTPPPVDPVKNKVVLTTDNQSLWNVNPISNGQLVSRLQEGLKMPVEPELQIQPDPYARYIVVDRVMAVVKRSGVGKLGFVGNEQYARVF